MTATLGTEAGWTLEEANRWILYHGAIAREMTATRTALESALIPVTAYILVSGVECYRRHPEMMRAIAAAMRPEEIGSAGRRPGTQVDSVHLWSIANIYLLGRQVLAPFGMITPADDIERTATVLDFWKRAAVPWRGDGYLQAWDAGSVVRPYDGDVVEELVAGTTVIDDDERARVRKLNAALTSYLFLLYFDTRAGYQDTGPYELGDGRVLLVRDFSEFGVGHFPWSADVAADLPYSNLTAAFVLDGVHIRVTDWGTSITAPDDYLAHLRAFGLFAPTRDGALEPISLSDVDALAVAVKAAQRRCYRLIAGMTRHERINAGAYVYFTFLRPFADLAGVANELDWTVPRDSLDLYEGIASLDRLPDVAADDGVPYYTPIPEMPG
ncbi:MAG: hypothetical protein ACRDY6_00100 [Acidimicrobiia bacterium]